MSVHALGDAAVTTDPTTEAVRPHTPGIPRVLAVAGSDPSGGAGIQADLKSIAAADGYGMAAITALTAQNTRGVREVHVPPAEFLAAQLDAVTDDVCIDAVKIGMLGSRAVADTVGAWLAALPRGATTRRPAVVLDPVMIATSGDRLLDPDAEQAVLALVALADVVTPNLPELAVLLGEPVAADWPAAVAQAQRLAARHGVLVLAKGGHLDGESLPDALVGADGVLARVSGPRLLTSATHGTGCSLSSGLATRYARSGDWGVALAETKTWLEAAIRGGEALAVGSGNGPVDHLVTLRAAAATGIANTDARVAGPAPDAAPDVDAGDVVDAWWATAGAQLEEIDALEFIRTLGDGTLDADRFRYYLTQDALYLREYSRALATCSALAPTRAEQAFWAQGAQGAVATEMDLHTTWLGGEPVGVPQSPTTSAYLDHLRAAGSDYATLVAAVLPCFWIYQDVGERLAERNHDAHPYSDWLGTYADEAFAASTRQAVSILRRAAAAASPEQRRRMAAAFARACEHEVAFFDQAHARARSGAERLVPTT